MKVELAWMAYSLFMALVGWLIDDDDDDDEGKLCMSVSHFPWHR
jgi:hypothetical protein